MRDFHLVAEAKTRITESTITSVSAKSIAETSQTRVPFKKVFFQLKIQIAQEK